MQQVARQFDRRAHFRVSVRIAAQLSGQHQTIAVETINLSLGGARVRLLFPLSSTFLVDWDALTMDGLGTYDCRIIWHDRTTMGLQFLQPASERSLLAAFLAT